MNKIEGKFSPGEVNCQPSGRFDGEAKNILSEVFLLSSQLDDILFGKDRDG